MKPGICNAHLKSHCLIWLKHQTGIKNCLLFSQWDSAKVEFMEEAMWGGGVEHKCVKYKNRAYS